jgi:hypothetical protein
MHMALSGSLEEVVAQSRLRRCLRRCGTSSSRARWSARPATVENFTTWTALSQRDAKAAMQRLPLVPVAVEGFSEGNRSPAQAVRAS